MKQKQIFLAGALSIFLLGTVIMPVHAEEKTTDVVYTQPNSWEVSIPITTLSQTNETVQTVTATAMNISPDKKLQVTIIVKDSQGNEIIDSQGRITLTRTIDRLATTTSVVSTTANSGNPITEDTVIAEFENQSTDFVNGTTGELYFSAVDKDTKAGDYTGSIVYVMGTVDKN